MAEFLRPSFNSSSDAETGDKKPESKKKREKRDSSSSATAAERAAQAPKRVDVGNILSVVLGENEPVGQAAKPKSKETAPESATPTADKHKPAEPGEQITTSADQEPWPMLDLVLDNERVGVEVVVNLHDDDVTRHGIERPRHEPLPAEPPETLAEAEAEPKQPAEPIQWNRQPEQQHQARMQPEQPAAVVAAVAPEAAPAPAVGGEIPPIQPPEAHQSYFERPHFPAEPLRPERQVAYMHSAPVLPTLNMHRSVAAPEQLVTKREMKKATEEAHRSGFGSGLLLGGIIAYLEHRRHKKREKRQEKKRIVAQKGYEKAQKDFHFTAEEQASKQRQTEREQLKTQQELEANRVLLEKLTAQKNEQAQAFLEGLPKVAAGNRLDMQGAYAEEIDKKTGKRAEQSQFRHGAEYYKDQKEIAPKALRSAAAGEVALVAAAMSQRGGVSGGSILPTTAPIPSATTQGMPARVKVTTKITRKDTKQASQPIWPWLIALAVVAVCLALVLH